MIFSPKSVSVILARGMPREASPALFAPPRKSASGPLTPIGSLSTALCPTPLTTLPKSGMPGFLARQSRARITFYGATLANSAISFDVSRETS
jgi:hypothetical protein